MSRYGDAWDAKRARIRERISRWLPRVFLEFPFEVLVASVTLLMGLPFLLGTAAPASLLALVGSVAFHLWAAALVIGGGTVFAGLFLPAYPNPQILAAGLQLAGGAFGVYAIGALAVLGLAGWTGFAAYILLALLAFVRCHHFRRIADIQRGAGQLLKKEASE